MKTTRGWWFLNIEGIMELNDTDREHIAAQIKEGFTSGEVVQEEEYPDAWLEDDTYTRQDWQYEVRNGDTNLGYRAWVASCKEADEYNIEDP